MLRILSILLFISILLSESETVAISYFDNTSGMEEFNPLSKGLADMLITDLSNIKSINIVEREKLEVLLKEIELGDSGFINKETAQKLGEGLGATYMLTGSFLIMGETMRIDARLVDVGSGKVIMAEEITGKKNTFFELEKDLVNKLIDTFDISLSKSEARKVKKIQTESFDSFNSYSSALVELDEGNFEKSIELLEQATEFDEDFEIAWETLENIEEKLETLLLARKSGLNSGMISLLERIDKEEEQAVGEVVMFMGSLWNNTKDLPFNEFSSEVTKGISFIRKIKNTMQNNGLFDMYYYGYEIEEIINRLYINYLIYVKYEFNNFDNKEIIDINGDVVLKYNDIDKIIFSISTQMMEKFPTSPYFEEWKMHINNIMELNK